KEDNEKVSQIRKMQEAGAIVESMQVDVTDERAVGVAIRSIEDRFGAIHGVVHAAGTLDDELLVNKSLQSAHRVLRPKVLGTLVLWEALKDHDLDFFWLYSSVSAMAGLPGQSDYAAANAFLDAFAYAQSSQGYPVLSIAWGPWRDAGMAATLGKDREQKNAGASQPMQHPFLQKIICDSPQQLVFTAMVGPDTSWLLDEHRLASGEALIPGTGFVEMARAATAKANETELFEMREFFLVQPLIVEDGAEREIRVVLDREQGQFAIVSRQEGGVWVDHVRGEAVRAELADPISVDLESILRRCGQRTQLFDGPPSPPHLRFGPRWGCLKAVHFGTNEAFAELEMPERFLTDLDQLGAHPALLDLATGCAHALIEGNEDLTDFFVPMAYGRIQLAPHIPPRIFSHIRYRPSEEPGADVVFFDVTLFDSSGVEVGRLDDFMLKRVAGDQGLIPIRASESEASSIRMFDDIAVEPSPENGLGALMNNGIQSKEAPDLFNRLLRSRLTGRVSVLPHELGRWLEAVRPQRPEAAGASRMEDPILQADLTESRTGLLEFKGVKDAWVTAHFDRPGERRLLGHVVFEADHSGTVSELRKGLRKNLSSDLVPQNFNELNELPRGPEGDVDVAALEDPFCLADDFEAPRSESEKAVAQIWQEILGVDRVGVYDNFFDVGGHSLLAMRVIVRSEKRLGARLNNAMMVLQTLEQIAAEVDKQTGSTSQNDKGGTLEDAWVRPAAEASNRKNGDPKGLSGRLLRAVRRSVKADEDG
ncbi:MAG: SDR family oxidoreductase, partial [Myxococcota bacterium]|nr:SDR family oxidoreductase [Myxococcota bacterium]